MEKARANWVTNRERKRVRVRVWDDQGLDTSGFTVDISPSGVFIESVRDVDVGARIHLELDANGRSFFTEGVVARVRRVHRSAKAIKRPGFGVRFVNAMEALRGAGGAGEDARALEADLREVDALTHAYARDIKLGVLTVRASRLPPIGADVRVRLILPSPHKPVVVQGEVQAHLPEMPGIGVRLREAPLVRRLIEEVLSFRV